jgi:DNA (cytosine-5)-methyltransferase 1
VRAVSLFSGVGGFEQGLQRAGIQTVLQVENDPWCLSVLARHWPEVQRIDDVRKVGRGVDGIDLVYGGWPCQGNSVAGKRNGLSDERSGLWHEVRRVLSELRPRWFVGENVPGLFSVNRGRDFLRILMDLDDLGYGVAWRTVDARWFGVPQRRRRVFVVGYLGDASRAAAVLAVCNSCGGHPQTRRETGQGSAAEADGGVTGTLGGHHGNVRADQAWTSQLVAGSFQQSSLAGKGTFGYDEDPDVLKPVQDSDGQMIVIGSQIDEGAARPLVAKPSGYRMDMESETFVVARSLTSPSPGKGGSYRLDDHENLVAPTMMGVRRLTPLENERLQGWADDHTRWTADGKEIPDSHRYRCIGNGVVAPVAEWIGHRLVEADRWR